MKDFMRNLAVSIHYLRWCLLSCEKNQQKPSPKPLRERINRLADSPRLASKATFSLSEIAKIITKKYMLTDDLISEMDEQSEAVKKRMVENRSRRASFEADVVGGKITKSPLKK